MNLYKIIALTILASSSTFAMQDVPSSIGRQASYGQRSGLKERPELLGVLKSQLMEIITPLVKENEILRKQYEVLSATPYKPQHHSSHPTVQEKPLKIESLGTGGDLVERIFADLSRKILGIISDLIDEKAWLKNQLIQDRKLSDQGSNIGRKVEMGQSSENREIDRFTPQFLFNQESIFFSVPSEVINLILRCLNPARDQNNLYSLSYTCTTFNAYVLKRYAQGCEIERHCTWYSNESLNWRELYILNLHIRTIMGLYINLWEEEKDEIDVMRFRTLCTLLLRAHLFPKASIPIIYLEFLQLIMSDQMLTGQYDVNEEEFTLSILEKMDKCENGFSKLKVEGYTELHGEVALYHHFIQYPLQQLGHPKCSHGDLGTLYPSLPDNNLTVVMNKELIAQKRRIGGSTDAKFADSWKKIIDLEPAPTIKQLCNAAYSHSRFGIEEKDVHIKKKYLIRSTEYYEDAIKTMKYRRLNSVNEFKNIADVYYELCKIPGELGFILTNLTKAVEYYEASEEGGIDLVYKDRCNAFSACLYIAKNIADLTLKVIYAVKAVEQYEKILKFIKYIGDEITSVDCELIASAHNLVGLYTTDLHLKTVNFEKAAEYNEEKLRLICNMGENPKAIDYYTTAEVWFHAGQNHTNPNQKNRYFNKASGYYNKYLEEVIDNIKIKDIHKKLAEIYNYFENSKEYKDS